MISLLRNIKNKVYGTYLRVLSSIAFYPALIATSLFLLAIVMVNVEDRSVTRFIQENFPFLVINDPDTARTILGTIIGGIISLTVFSFSMVMVLLNQASSSFSPRLLPGLISEKENQIVLGTFLGTIIYNLIVLISVVPTEDDLTLNGFSTLLGLALGILSLAMFVFFIHNISTSIQVKNIVHKTYTKGKERLNALLEELEDIPSRSDMPEHQVISDKVGYFQGVNLEGLKEIADELEIDIKVLPYKGRYVLPEEGLLAVSKSVSDDDQARLRDCLIFSNNQNLQDNYVIAIRQISEVGIKAMSPGINDPGTAIMTIDFLSELLALRMRLPDIEVYLTDDEHYVELATVDFYGIIYPLMAGYRQYCKHDILLMQKLIDMVKYLLCLDAFDDKYHDILNAEMKALKADVEAHIANQHDLRYLADQLSDI